MVDLATCIYGSLKWIDGPFNFFNAKRVVPGSSFCFLAVSFSFLLLFNFQRKLFLFRQRSMKKLFIFIFLINEIYIDLVLEIASSIVCIIVSFTLYSAIVKNVDFKSLYVGSIILLLYYFFYSLFFFFLLCLLLPFSTKRYYKWFMISLWGGSFIYPLISLIVMDSSSQVYSLLSSLSFFL